MRELKFRAWANTHRKGQYRMKSNDGQYDISLCQKSAEILEVIGNIYKNPELLEVKK